MDALPSAVDTHPGQRGSGLRHGQSGSAFPSVLNARTIESRDQLVARRRAAQRAWRSACERAERATQYLREALNAAPSPGATKARERLEHAQRGERRARRLYYRVAEETGALLSSLERTDAGIV